MGDAMSRDKPSWTRRDILTGLAAGTLGLGGCQTGDLDIPLKIGGTEVNVGRVFSGLGSIFEGLDLGEAEEIEMGQKLYPNLIARSGGAYRSRRAQTAMRAIFDGRMAPARERDLPWEVTVLDDDTVNAWALPGGKIAVNKGLLRYIDSEDELAAVIGHEMGHVELSHAIGEMRQEKFSEGFTTLSAEALMSQVDRGGVDGLLTDQAIEALAGPMHEMVTSGYSRGAEREADSHMVKVCLTTNYDPAEGTTFFRTLLEIIPADSELTTSLFSTHPGTRNRIDAILAEVRSFPTPARRPASPAFAALKESFPTRRVYKRNVSA